MSGRKERRLTLYRDDSTAQVIYDRVKTHFFTANNSVLTISRYDADEGDGHHYIHWPRERFCWFRDEPIVANLERHGLSDTVNVERLSSFAKGGPFVWWQDGGTDFNALRADLLALLSARSEGGEK